MTASLSGVFNTQQFTDTGAPASGYRLYTYAPGTTTHKAAYTDAAAATPHTYTSDGIGGLYIALNARGELPAPLFLLAGGYDVTLKTPAGATVWTRRASGSTDSDRLLDTTSASGGAGLIGFGYAVSYPANTIGWANKLHGVYAAWFTGYDPTGAADSASAIQAAINYANTSGTHTVFITGKPKISSPLTYSTMLAMVGVDGGNSFSNNPDAYPNAIRCGGVTGYVFDQPDTVDGSGGLSLSNLCFDGRTGGVNSSTLQGLVNASTTAGTSSFFLRMNNCMVGGSNSATPILALSGEVFARFDNCFFANWPYGYGHKGGLASILATTITFNKCSWNSLRQVGEWLTNVTDVTYNDCVMESCVVGVAAAFTNVTFNNLYTENMGYDPSGTGATTGLTARALGVTDAPAISGNVSAVFTNRYGQFIFNQPTIQTTVGGKKWFDGIGRGSASGGGGAMVINDIGFAGGVVSTLFAADADTPSSRANFEYHLTARAGQLYVSEADARMVTKGRVPILWSDTNSRIVEVNNGVFTMPPLAVGGLTAIPSIYPSGGTNRVGDVIKLAPSVFREGIRTAYRCVVAGTTASKWTVCDFIASSLSATVAAAGTMNLVASSADNPGELHVWEITASTGANIESRYRVSMQAFTGAGQLGVESIVTTRALSFSMTWGDPYTIVVTNGSGVSLNIYARLVSISSTHA